MRCLSDDTTSLAHDPVSQWKRTSLEAGGLEKFQLRWHESCTIRFTHGYSVSKLVGILEMHGVIAKCAFCVLAIGLALNGQSNQSTFAAVAIKASGEVRNDVDVLARGPIHEAFVEPVNRDPLSSQVIPRQPPQTIEEVPPDFKPEGDNVIWIPGYWAWDDERQDFIWVSGVWREVPPNRRWVPGYWNQSESGYQWISGFWADGESEEFGYLDAPPASLEHGPSSVAPADNYFWSPGCWVHRDTRYHWRPGYWQPYRENWIWVPARYLWSPGGCIYVSGYWDYRVAYRGQLFTPAYFHHPVYARPGYCYTPSHVINTTSFFLHLFVCLQDRHYYYGDYHGQHPRHGNFCSHAYFHKRGYGYDPLFVYYRHHYRRHGIDYGHRLDEWHVYFDKHKIIALRTVPKQLEFAKRHRDHKQLDHLALARALDREVANPRRGRTLVPVAKGEKAVVAQDISELRNFSRKRGQLEGRTGRTIRRDIDRLRERGTSQPLTLKPPRTSHRPAGRDRLVRSDPPRGTSAAYSKRHVVGRAVKKSPRHQGLFPILHGRACNDEGGSFQPLPNSTRPAVVFADSATHSSAAEVTNQNPESARPIQRATHADDKKSSTQHQVADWCTDAHTRSASANAAAPASQAVANVRPTGAGQRGSQSEPKS